MKYFTLKMVMATIVALSAVPFLKLAERYQFEYQIYESNVLGQYISSLMFATALFTTAFWLAVWAFATLDRHEW
jgi:hypothetical protein